MRQAALRKLSLCAKDCQITALALDSVDTWSLDPWAKAGPEVPTFGVASRASANMLTRGDSSHPVTYGIPNRIWNLGLGTWVENCRNARGCFSSGGRSVQSEMINYSCLHRYKPNMNVKTTITLMDRIETVFR